MLPNPSQLKWKDKELGELSKEELIVIVAFLWENRQPMGAQGVESNKSFMQLLYSLARQFVTWYEKEFKKGV